MKNFNYKAESLLWIVVIIPLIYLAYVWNALPERVPIHFGADGVPNGWGGKTSELLLPVINLFTYLLILFIPKIDPKKMSAEFFQTNFYKIRFAISFFLSLINVIVIKAALPGAAHNTPNWIPASTFLFIAILGNFMINIKPNWFVGIRTPWTLSSDTVWRKTHQVGGRVLFYGGLFCFALALTLKGEWLTGLILIFVLGSAAFFFLYSLWLFKQEEKQRDQ